MTKLIHSVSGLAGFLKSQKPSGVLVVTSKRLFPKVRHVMAPMRPFRPEIVFVPDGEKAKTWKELERLLVLFEKASLDRSSIVIALGGGTVGDLAGFAASIYLRGIRYVEIPTTLVAQADSAHGGKTGIDFHGAKNQLGSFYAPIAVVSDPRFLRSLPDGQIVDGLGEILKCGLVMDASILSLVKGKTLSFLRNGRTLETLVKKAVAVKYHFVGRDMTERGERIFLNFGHTYGHAVELRYGLSHGYAVILGCLKELELGEGLGVTPPAVRRSFISLLDGLGIPQRTGLHADLRTMAHDKKASGGKISIPLVLKEGNSKIFRIDIERLQKIWR